MEKYLIEIKNGGDRVSCLRSIQSYLASRTHYITGAEWGCIEEEHKAWLVIKTENREDAMRVIPAAYRQFAKITRLHKFTGKEINASMMEPPLEVAAKSRHQHQFKDYGANAH